MTTNVATVSVNIPSLQMDLAELVEVLESSLYPGAAPASIKLVIGYCKAQQLDPMQKPVHIVPMKVKEKKKDRQGNALAGFTTRWRDVIMPGVGLYRTNASRTEAYAGIDPAEYGDDITEDLGGEAKKEWDDDAGNGQGAYVDKGGKWEAVKFTYPKWCSVTVYRIVQGQVRAFSSGRVFFKETYATAGNETTLPNAMWKKRPYGQIEKCAEALALRRAFPELGAAPTAEEMEGKTIDHEELSGDGTVRAPQQVPGPQAKSAPPPPPPPARPGREPEPDTDGAEPEADAKQPGDDAGGKTVVKKPISPGAANILRRKLAASGKNEVDLNAKFGFKAIEEVTTDRFNEITDWADQPAKT